MNKKWLVISEVTLVISGLLAAGTLFFHIAAPNLTAWAQSTENHQQLLVNAEAAAGKTEAKVPKAIAISKLGDRKAPVITADDVSITAGNNVNVLDNVTAKDNEDGDVTNKIETTGNVDTETPGTYSIELAVTDNSGNTGKTEKTVTVTAAQPAAATPQQETSPAPAAPVATPTPAASTTTETAAPAAETAAPAYAPMTMYFAGAAIPYQNAGQGSGQAVIDGNPYGTAATWGGAATYSGSDGMNTHFIGHNPGLFASVFALGQGSQITVTDGNGAPTTYTVNSIFTVDDNAIGTADGQNYWGLITGTDGERITLQTCIDDATNIIVVAYA